MEDGWLALVAMVLLRFLRDEWKYPTPFLCCISRRYSHGMGWTVQLCIAGVGRNAIFDTMKMREAVV